MDTKASLADEMHEWLSLHGDRWIWDEVTDLENPDTLLNDAGIWDWLARYEALRALSRLSSKQKEQSK